MSLFYEKKKDIQTLKRYKAGLWVPSNKNFKNTIGYNKNNESDSFTLQTIRFIHNIKHTFIT